MLAIAVTVAALIACFLALLAVPVVLAVDVERADALEARWRLLWLFGLVVIDSTTGESAPPRPTRPDEAKSARKVHRAKRSGGGLRMGLAVLRTHGLFHQVGRLVTRLLRQLKLQRLHLQADFGFDDPSDTGMVYGMLSPLLVMADVRGFDVHCRPMFLEAGVKGVLGATVQVRPLSVAATVLAFCVSPPVFRAAASAWRART